MSKFTSGKTDETGILSYSGEVTIAYSGKGFGLPFCLNIRGYCGAQSVFCIFFEKYLCRGPGFPGRDTLFGVSAEDYRNRAGFED